MSLPVSQYEALLAEVRGLREKAQYVQQLATPLLVSAIIFLKYFTNITYSYKLLRVKFFYALSFG